MKIRIDFISNSSGTTFAMYGKNFRDDIYDDEKLVNRIWLILLSRCKNDIYFDDLLKHDTYDIFSEAMEIIRDFIPFLVFVQHGNGFWLGGDCENLGMNETRKEYEKRIYDILTGLGFPIDEEEVSYHLEHYQP